MLESFKRNKKGILLMLIASLCACVGQLLWKLSAERGMLMMLAGFAIYGVGALFMMVSYRYGKLSVLQPVLSMSYVLSTFVAILVLNETVSLTRWAGVLVMIIGVVLVAGGDRE